MSSTKMKTLKAGVAPFPSDMIRPRRKITGMSAVLLPFTPEGAVDWDGFSRHLARTAEAGLQPAVNMDTGYVSLIGEKTRRAVLEHTQETLGGSSFVAGAFVADAADDVFDADAYRHQIDLIQQYGGTPIIFQSYGLTSLEGARVLEAYAALAQNCSEFIAFELGEMFAPFGRIYELETFAGLLDLPACIGAKHSSLSRQLEWERLSLRDERRPDFKIFTGNDLAIDMIVYGSDYLLGISTLAPDLFARRDKLWAEGNSSFYELNDLLQYLGFFAFRPPVPAYKHSAAQFLKLRGWIQSDAPHPEGKRRPESDQPVLRDLAERLGIQLRD